MPLFYFFFFVMKEQSLKAFSTSPASFSPPPLILLPLLRVESQILSEARGQFETLLLSYFSVLMMLFRLSFVFGYNRFLSASDWALGSQEGPLHPFMLSLWTTETGNLIQLKKENELGRAE